MYSYEPCRLTVGGVMAGTEYYRTVHVLTSRPAFSKGLDQKATKTDSCDYAWFQFSETQPSMGGSVGLAIATTWPSLFATHGSRIAWSWRDLLTGLVRDLPRRRTDCGWSPVLCSGDRRGSEHVETVTALVLDYDDGTRDMQQVADAWGQWRGLVHTSKSHTPDHPRLRVVLPLERPATPEEHARLYRWALRRAPELDRHARDPARFWWWPSTDTGYVGHTWLRGRLLRVADAPDVRPVATTTAPTHRGFGYASGALRGAANEIASAGKGSRHATIVTQAWKMARFVRSGELPESAVVDELVGAAMACGCPEREAARLVSDGLKNGVRQCR